MRIPSPRRAQRLRHWLAAVCVGLLLVNYSASAQGPLTNGFTHTGTLSTSEQETWTFTARPGDGILIKLGEAVVGSSLYPRLRLYGPGGGLLSESASATAAEVATRATNSGTFTVVLANADHDFYVATGRTVTIKGRKWVVKNSRGEITAVEGDGVVGKCPCLEPGESFSYHSFHLNDTTTAVVSCGSTLAIAFSARARNVGLAVVMTGSVRAKDGGRVRLRGSQG